jgi:DNA helicase-2/ATP-dependent DNA helicase PcrA
MRARHSIPETAASALLEGLNERQREAVEHGEGPLLIFAGAGSGKTRVLTHRAAYLLARGLVRPENLLLVTFTNKAAEEMKQRIARLVRRGHWEIWVGTFHSTCARLLRVEGEAIGVPRNFVIFDQADQGALMKDCLKVVKEAERFEPGAVLNEISKAKNELIDSARYRQTKGADFFEETCARAYLLYARRLRENNALDFDDLIMETVRLFDESPPVLARWQERFRHVLVDEYQDINFAQYRFVQQLVSQHRNLCVVGDDDQSIYGWRGADMRIILRFEQDYPEAKTVKLEQNYRSTQNILDAAWHVISRNSLRREKRLWTRAPRGERIYLHQASDEHAEAIFVANTIEDLLQTEGRRHADFAVLYRTNAQSRVLEKVFVSFGIPYRIVGGLRFWDRGEIKDLLAYLRVIYNPKDSVSLKRILNVPPRGLGDTTRARLEAVALERNLSLLDALHHAEAIPGVGPRPLEAINRFLNTLNLLLEKSRELTISDLTALVITESGYQRWLEEDGTIKARARLDNVKELVTATQEFEELAPSVYPGQSRGEVEGANEQAGLSDFLENVALLTSADDLAKLGEAVPLMTLHCAKGLEFPVVFMVGLEEGLFPLARAAQSANRLELEEERRLCYVGMTRAKERLFLALAASRHIFGATSYNKASRFLEELPGELLEGAPVSPRRITWQTADATAAPAAKAILAAAGAGAPPFQAGERVRHPRFGEGLVVGTQGTGPKLVVLVSFGKGAIKKLDPSFVNLEKI